MKVFPIHLRRENQVHISLYQMLYYLAVWFCFHNFLASLLNAENGDFSAASGLHSKDSRGT